jgi:hypothetical protein
MDITVHIYSAHGLDAVSIVVSDAMAMGQICMTINGEDFYLSTAEADELIAALQVINERRRVQ